MAIINFARREVEAKVVYYGPAFSGKTTNVKVLHDLMPGPQRGELHSLATEADRTLFFDYVPVQMGNIGGFTCKFKLFTVPGQVVYQQTRRVVLQGADAVVFVADSTPDRADSNLDSLVDLEENLRAHGLDLASIPLVLQLNKRDAPEARTVEEMLTDLNPFGVPHVEAVAADGKGVMETLKLVTDIAAQRIRENLAGQKTAMNLTAVENPVAEDEKRVVREHIERIKQVRPEEVQKAQEMQAAGRVHMETVDAFLAENVDRGKATQKLDRSALPAEKAVDKGPGGYEVSRPMKLADRPAPRPPPPPPPPPAPAPKAVYPVGPPLEALLTVDQPSGMRMKEVLGSLIGPDGRARMEVLVERGGQLSRQTVTMITKETVKPGAPAWVSAAVAGVLALGIGVVIGVGIGWAMFH